MKYIFTALSLSIFTSMMAQEPDYVAYKKALPVISADGKIKTTDGKTVIIEGFKDSNRVIFFLVRHAEKDTSGGTNADLNGIGRGRAEALVNMFKKIRIHGIYSTDKPRTRHTGEPLAKQKRRPVEIYDANKQADLAEILSKRIGKRYFIVGHSNTIPKFVDILRGSVLEKDLPDNEYSRLYIVSVKTLGEATVYVINF